MDAPRVIFEQRTPSKANGAIPAGSPYAEYRKAETVPRSPSLHESPTEIVQRWRTQGPIVRLATGFKALDVACRGGLPIPWRVVIVGAPSAGKTALLMAVVRRLVSDGLVAGVLGVDEEPDDLTVRLAQMAGFRIEDCEGRDPKVLDGIASALETLPVRFYSFEHTIESAAEDLAQWARSLGKRAVLAIDSAQTVRCAAIAMAQREKSAREIVDANMRAVRVVATMHRLLVLMTSEANRGAYRNEDAIDATNDMAAGKESGSIEYMAQTLLMLRTPKGYPNCVHVRVPKNRRAACGSFEFWLRLDREQHALTECADPSTGDDGHDAQQARDRERAHGRAAVHADAKVLAAVVQAHPGIGARELRGALRAAGHPWGVDRIEGAKTVLAAGFAGQRLVDRGDRKCCQWHLERVAAQGEGDSNG